MHLKYIQFLKNKLIQDQLNYFIRIWFFLDSLYSATFCIRFSLRCYGKDGDSKFKSSIKEQVSILQESSKNLTAPHWL